jgi:hypothetical protein
MSQSIRDDWWAVTVWHLVATSRHYQKVRDIPAH